MEYLKLFFLVCRVYEGRRRRQRLRVHKHIVDLRKSSLILSHIWDSIHLLCEQNRRGKKGPIFAKHTKWLGKEWLSYLLGLSPRDGLKVLERIVEDYFPEFVLNEWMRVPGRQHVEGFVRRKSGS